MATLLQHSNLMEWSCRKNKLVHNINHLSGSVGLCIVHSCTKTGCHLVLILFPIYLFNFHSTV